MPQEKAKQLYQFLIYSVIFGLKKVPIVGAAVEFAADWQNNVKIQLNQQANLKVQERLAQIEQAMLCLPDEVRKMAQEMIAEQRRLGVDISPEQEEAVVDLASAMPAAIRERTQATLRQARQHGTALHTVIPVGEQVSTQERAEFYQSLLPARRSAFRENDWLPHRNPPWQLVQLLGAGGFGEVWEARHPQLNDRFAVKFCQDEASAKVLKQEAAALFRLRKELPEHPNIVHLLDLQLDKEPYWLAFEYVPGGTLEALMRGASLTWQEALAIFLPIVEGMSAVHKVGIVHRDLKPANILLTEAGVSKITDFGIGKVMEEQERTRLLLSRSLTMASFGSAGYASLEQIKGLPAHPADDTYALGVLLWQLVTHTLQPPQYVQRSLKGVQIPDVMKTLIIDCLENPRAERPQRAEELLKVLQPLADELARRKAEEELLIKRKADEEAKKATEREQRTKQIALTIKKLSPFNPLDWWRLLVWICWSPLHLKVHREIFGVDREKYTAGWLFNTLAWLPLFLPILGLALEWLPPLHIVKWGVENYRIAVSVIGIIWLLTGIFAFAQFNKQIAGTIFHFSSIGLLFVGLWLIWAVFGQGREQKLDLWLVVLVFGVGGIANMIVFTIFDDCYYEKMAGFDIVAIVMRMIFGFLSAPAAFFIIVMPFMIFLWLPSILLAELAITVVAAFGVEGVGDIVNYLSSSVILAVDVIVVPKVVMKIAKMMNVSVYRLIEGILYGELAEGMEKKFINSLETGEPSITARIALIVILLCYAFIFWYSLLGGWRFFS